MIVGLMGYARSGKDTVADFLVERYGFKRVAFADALKAMALEINPTIDCVTVNDTLRDHVEVLGWEGAKRTHGVRVFLQDLGMACRNTFGAECWVNIVEKQIYAGLMGEHVVITDVRFPNEAEMIKAYAATGNAELWRVHRPGNKPVNGHQSETAVDHVAATRDIYNDGTIADLHETIEFELLAAPCVPQP